jgi:hypothetical protein
MFLEKIRSILSTRNSKQKNIEILDKSISNAKLRLNKIKNKISMILHEQGNLLNNNNK